MLTEEQIARYARQILLREVGGAGQERLLTTPLRAGGDAATILRAGGTPLSPDGERARVRGREGEVAIRRIDGRTLVTWTRAGLCAHHLHPEPSLLASALAALIAQQLALGMLDRDGAIALSDDGTTTRTAYPECAECPK